MSDAKKPYRILVVTEGSEGDNRPPLAVAMRLAALGHEITACVPEDFVPLFSSQGIRTFPMGTSSREFFEANAHTMYDRNLMGFRTMLRQYKDGVMRQFNTMPQHFREADAVLASGFIFAGGTIAERYKLPMIHIVHAPVYFPTRFLPPTNMRNLHLPRLFNILSWKAFIFALNRVSLGAINRYRKHIGLPLLSTVKDYLLRHMVLAMDPGLAQLPPDCARYGISQTAYPSFALHGECSRELTHFINRGPKPVYIGFGSMIDPDGEKLFSMIRKALEKSGLRAVVHAHWLQAKQNEVIDDRIFSSGFAPHAEIFPRMSAVVHHGSAGTSHSAAAAGIPQVTIPHLLDQYYLSDRVHSAGLGPSPLLRRSLTADKLAAAILDATGNPLYRQSAETASREIKARDGANEVAQLLIKLVDKQRNIRQT